jgi:hypothetical protein
VHLGHRVSHYREFFNHRNAIDHGQLTRAIDTAGAFTTTVRAPKTLNALLSNQDSASSRG